MANFTKLHLAHEISEFYLCFTFLVKFDIYFLEMLFGIITDNTSLALLKNVKKCNIL